MYLRVNLHKSSTHSIFVFQNFKSASSQFLKNLTDWMKGYGQVKTELNTEKTLKVSIRPLDKTDDSPDS